MPLKLRNRAVETLLTAWAEPWVGVRARARARRRTAGARAGVAGAAVQPGARLDLRLLDRPRARAHGRALRRRRRARHGDGATRARTARGRERHARHAVARGADGRRVQRVGRRRAPTSCAFRSKASRRGGSASRRFDIHPLAMPSFAGVTVDGRPARLVASDDPDRACASCPASAGSTSSSSPRDVPAFGCRRYAVEPADAGARRRRRRARDRRGRRARRRGDDGTLSVTLGDRTYDGLFGIEDAIDRGDSYDCDPDPVRDVRVRVGHRRADAPRVGHRAAARRARARPRSARSPSRRASRPACRSCAARSTLDNRAPDHRLRLRFPTGAPVDTFDAATTFDTARRSTAPVDDTGWVHPAPRTFPHQGWIAANGLVVGAPGLPEAEVTPDGDVLVTLVRSVGALARIELRTRPMPAGPEMMAPGAQTQGPRRRDHHARAAPPPTRARPRSASGACSAATRRCSSRTRRCSSSTRVHCVLSACKPAQDGDAHRRARAQPDRRARRRDAALRPRRAPGPARPLDEHPDEFYVKHHGRDVSFHVPPHALRTVRVTFG